jgi:mannose-6-phosphate isomerase-like protein (cupin superfamily)
MDVRRVVTGHTPEGESCVMIDDLASNATSRRPGHDSRLIWHTNSAPAKFMTTNDEGAASVGRPPPPSGTIFRILEIQPGVTAEPHATETIDYAVVISGEMDMDLDTGSVTLKAGDVLVQQGTKHNWINRGTVPCRFAVVLIDGDRNLTD